MVVGADVSNVLIDYASSSLMDFDVLVRCSCSEPADCSGAEAGAATIDISG